MTFEDVMQFRAIEDAVISNDGTWIAYTSRPDRGDPEAIIQSVDGSSTYNIPLGSDPVFSADTRWVAVKTNPGLEATEKAKAKKAKDDDQPKSGLMLVDLASGDTTSFARVRSFSFSGEGGRLISHLFKASPDSTSADGPDDEDAGDDREAGKDAGTTLVIRDLGTAGEIEVPGVASYSVADESDAVAFVVSGDSARVGVHLFPAEATDPIGVLLADGLKADALTFSESGDRLAFVTRKGGEDEDTDGEEDEGEVGEAQEGAVGAESTEGAGHHGSEDDDTADMPVEHAAWWVDAAGPELSPHRVGGTPDGWHTPLKNTLRWSEDGSRLFLGLRPVEDDSDRDDRDDGHAGDNDGGAAASEGHAGKESEDSNPYDIEGLLKKKEADVWHWNDPLINPNQKQGWKALQDRTYQAVYSLDSGRLTQVESLDEQAGRIEDDAEFAYVRNPAPYYKLRTWDGTYADLHAVDLSSGERTPIAERVGGFGGSSASPTGRYSVFYNNESWLLFDASTGEVRNVTQGLGVPFANEDHDYPQAAPGYGSAGWVGGEGVLINDKYDVWYVPTDGSPAEMITDGRGRASGRTFRVIRTDPDQRWFEPGQELLLSSYHNTEKNWGFYRTELGQPGVEQLLESEHTYSFVARAADADVYLITREDYAEFPDLWVTDPAFKELKKVSDHGGQLEEFAWGTSELVEWTSVDGTPLQGVLIKPGNYEEGKRYPVLIYFYRFMSQRLHSFNQPHVNHRPAFGFYASNGYAVFLPDVRFEVGRPGFSATKALVPGVQKLVDMGVADTDKLGLHGHSWSGYQTAFVVTQTDMFDAAIAGAPVSNMTSAYSGIRWGSGLARQFQYEKSQSRLGKSLFEGRDLYIDNSPVFFADRIRTPLLIMHGDDDGAVPWYQSIELYLAMRRLEKDVIFLQYRGEDHHLAKYPNKLDYAVKMKEYFDHYLLGTAPAEWITDGEAYAGN